jgi:hypothetical protein
LTAEVERRAVFGVEVEEHRLMFFKRRKPTPLPEAARMGARSKLVLAKLGYDLRACYGEPSADDLPDDIKALAERLERTTR